MEEDIQYYAIDRADGSTSYGVISDILSKGTGEYPTLELTDGTLLGTHIDNIHPVTAEEALGNNNED